MKALCSFMICCSKVCKTNQMVTRVTAWSYILALSSADCWCVACFPNLFLNKIDTVQGNYN